MTENERKKERERERERQILCVHAGDGKGGEGMEHIYRGFLINFLRLKKRNQFLLYDSIFFVMIYIFFVDESLFSIATANNAVPTLPSDALMITDQNVILRLICDIFVCRPSLDTDKLQNTRCLLFGAGK